MSRERTELHSILTDILESKNVYYQPPESIKLSYPCIIYSLSRFQTKFANDKRYRDLKCYDITLIDKSPVSKFMEQIRDLPYCELVRAPYVSDNLNHYKFQLYF